MMVCVQSFGMHFHLTDGDEHHQPHVHAHAHTYGSMDADHFTTEHEDEIGKDILSILTKHRLSLDLFVFAIIALISVALPKELGWL